MSLVCSFHTDLRPTIIYAQVLNRSGKGVAGSLSEVDRSTVANDP